MSLIPFSTERSREEMLKTYRVRYEFGRLIFPEHEQVLMPDTANVIITILDDDTSEIREPDVQRHDEKLSEAQRAVAHNFLVNMQELRKKGFSEEDDKAIADLQKSIK